LQQVLTRPDEFDVIATLNLMEIIFLMPSQHRSAASGLHPAGISIM
jgi:hypothetical protein